MAEDPVAMMSEIMATPVTVMKNGKSEKMTVARVIAEKMVADATSGNPRNLKQRLDFLERIASWRRASEPASSDGAHDVDHQALLLAKLEAVAQRQEERRSRGGDGLDPDEA